MRCICQSTAPAYIKVGRSAVEDIYTPQDELSGMTPHGTPPTGVLLVACGEVTQGAVQALRRLREAGYSAALLDAVSLKPFDQETLLRYAAAARVVVTVEEHAAWGGLYAAVSSVLSARMPRRVVGLTLPDAPVPAGSSAEVFRFLGLDADGIFETARRALEE